MIKIKNAIRPEADKNPIYFNVKISDVPVGVWFKATGWDQHWKIIARNPGRFSLHVTCSKVDPDNRDWRPGESFLVNVYPHLKIAGDRQ
jgi:hypothetical protein